MDRMAAMIEEALLILAQPVVVLVVRRGKGCADGVELRVGGTAVVFEFAVPALWLSSACAQPVISSSFLPSGVRKGDMRARSGAVEVFADVELGLERRRCGRPFRSTLTTMREDCYMSAVRSGLQLQPVALGARQCRIRAWPAGIPAEG